MTSVLYLGCPTPERADTEKLLGAVDVAVVWAETVPSALSELQRRNMPVLLDLSRGAAALQSAREIRTQRSSTLMFAVVDARRPDLTTEAVLAGMADVFARPLGGRRVANAIERELNNEARESIPAVLENGDDLYGHSAAMREVMTLVTRAAAMRASILIRGEQGTGRQVAARAIHAMQHGGGDGAFVLIDCAACDGEELDHELFGHPGRAHKDDGPTKGLERVSRQGRLYKARGGTLYLHNVADASTRMQARLARVLRDREAVLTDTGETIGFDVRPMAGVDPDSTARCRKGACARICSGASP